MSIQGVPVGRPVPIRGDVPLERGHPGGRFLYAEELIARALETEGRSSFHDPSFAEPLRRLVSALNREAQLNAFGRRAARFDVLRCLTNLLRLDAAEEADPGIARRTIERPIFITGLPRSGTTFLHGLLAQDRGNGVPRLWQLIHPYPFRHRLLYADWRRFRVALQLRLYRFVAPAVEELHPMRANGPQECSDITAQVFHSLRFDSMYNVPSYQSWIGTQEHVRAYRFHKRFLRHLDSQEPGRRWILKSPDHVFTLDAIRAVYPDAHFVFLHRDPAPVLASQLNLTEALRRSFAAHIDLKQIGTSVSNAIIETANRLVANRNSARVLHLGYHSLIAAPMEAVRRIYAHGGLTLAPGAGERMSRWLRQQKPSRARGHRRDPSEFGIDTRRVMTRFDLYRQTFDVHMQSLEDAREPAPRAA